MAAQPSFVPSEGVCWIDPCPPRQRDWWEEYSDEAELPFDLTLPARFDTAGLPLLRDEQFEAAADFYGRMTLQLPHAPDGWLGLAAVQFGKRHFRACSRLLLQVRGMEPHCPIAQLLAYVRPDEPKDWYELALALLEEREATACAIACEMLTAITRCGVASNDLYARALWLRRNIVEALRQGEFFVDPRAGRAHRLQRKRQLRRRLRIMAATLVAVLALSLGVWASRGVRADVLYSRGLADWMALHRASVPTARLEGLQKAYGEFSSAAELAPENFSAQAMLVASGREMKHYVKGEAADQLQARLALAEARLHDMDPSGERRRQLAVEVVDTDDLNVHALAQGFWK